MKNFLKKHWVLTFLIILIFLFKLVNNEKNIKGDYYKSTFNGIYIRYGYSAAHDPISMLVEAFLVFIDFPEKKIKDADLISFEVLDEHMYIAKDKNDVYLHDNKLENSDPKTFTTFSNCSSYCNFAKDKNNLYYVDDWDKYISIQDFDYESFEPIEKTSFYGKDKNNVYIYDHIFNNKILKIEGADPETFELLIKDRDGYFDEYTYSKDKNNVYFFGKKLNNLDISSFKILSDKGNIIKDNNSVFIKEKKIENADSNSIEILDDFCYFDLCYLKDKNNVYWDNKRAEGADPNTFYNIFKDRYGKIDFSRYARDKNYIYYEGEKITNTNFDLESFEITGEFDARDKYNTYSYGEVNGVKQCR